MVASLIVIIAAADDFARNAGFVDAADRNYARANGYNKAGDWAPMRARLASEQKIAESRRQEEEARLARERQEEEARLAAEAAREREEAEKRTAAEKRAKQEQCAVDLKCTAEEAWAAATTECSPLVERMAKNDFQWTDRWYETKFTHFKWGDPFHRSITFIGDKIKYQNGFGAWTFHIYECDFVLASQSVRDVRAHPGRLPQ
jgi:hypothetical protein